MFYLAALAGKVLQRVLRMMKKGGGSLPGLVVLKLCPSFLRHLKLPKTIIFVTGTNGKSTVTNLLAKVLREDGKSVISNLEGNNLKIGAVSLLLRHMDLSGRCFGDVLVLEVDELSVPRLLEDITPTHIVIGNLFRDQLDRVGEMETVIRRFEQCLAGYGNELFLNGDDPNVCRLALTAKQAKITYFGVDRHEGSVSESLEASEGRFCPICSEELTYDYYQYSHIGRFYCPNDGFGSHAIAFLAKLSGQNEGRMQYAVNDVSYMSAYDNVFAVYNEVAVIAIASRLGVDSDRIRSVIASFQMNNGRMERFTLKNGYPCVLNLAKNPTGVNESLKAMTRSDEECVFAVVLNDLDADGLDVSWIYDARFELLDRPNIRKLYASGTRLYDMALRLKYAGCPQPIVPIEDLDELVKALDEERCPVFIVANYTSLQPTRRALKRGSI